MSNHKLLWEEIQARAIKFSKAWKAASRERAQFQDWARALLGVFGVTGYVGEFDRPIKVGPKRTNYIDFYWEGHIAIEMKSKGKRLDEAFEQLRGYMDNLPEGHSPPPLWMVSDFESIRLYYPETGQAITFGADKLRKHLKRFANIAGYALEPLKEEKNAADVQAAEKMSKLFDDMQEHNYTGHGLEVYLARLLFCLFANDTGIFPQDSFHDYIKATAENGSDQDAQLARLFQDLNDPKEERAKGFGISNGFDRAEFRYINGKLFEENLRLPRFNKKMRQTLLDCLEFDWSQISPAIFGSMFQGIMDKEHRREIGAHYTSEENIKKLIGPLFMDSLWKEFNKIKQKRNYATLSSFHDRISRLKFLDPACGCGNFLAISYQELRQLEIEVIREKRALLTGPGKKAAKGVSKHIKGIEHQLLDIESEVQVKVSQFYGIEILSWPCQIAKTAMWLIDHQMNLKVSEEFGEYYERIPLKEETTIVNGNAHRIKWEDVVPKNELSYILGNPPFVGARWMSHEQKEDMQLVFGALKGIGNIDYVTAWYKQAADMMEGNKGIKTAFVSTNSIAQGEQVAILWKPLMGRGIYINFGIPTFKWSNEAKGKAAVHCVIVGFSYSKTEPNINPYLLKAPNVFIERRTRPLCDVPEMVFGSMPNDGGNLIVEENEYEEFLAKEPRAAIFVRRFAGAEEFINNLPRYCLWLGGVNPRELRKMPLVIERVEACKKHRANSKREATRKLAATPMLFGEIRQPGNDYILVPRVSSENRHYIPIGFVSSEIIASDAVQIIPSATLYHFGILTSRVHMAWTRAVCGRLKSDYRYSKDIVYNNFPWPEASDKQKAKIEDLAQGVLDARSLYPESSLADLYDPLAMPKELLKAHNALDRAVMKLYGFGSNTDEAGVVAELMKMYQKLVGRQE